jgi:hypothetical protein
MCESMPSKFRVTATVTEEIKEFLETWAEEEHRSISNLVAAVIIEAVKQKQQEQLKDKNRATEDDDNEQA